MTGARTGRGWARLALASAALALVVLVAVFMGASRLFRRTLAGYADAELRSRAELAAAHLAEPLATGDFRALRAFADTCAADGLRLTVFTAPGGIYFDSEKGPLVDALERTATAGEFRVRLARPMEDVLAPAHIADRGFLVAEGAGACAVLAFFFLYWRQRARIRELARLEAFRRDFTADVSHELKTPLTGILGAAELLADADEVMRPKLVDMLRKETGRLDALAQRVLSLARLENGFDVLHAAELDLVALVRETASRFDTQAAEKGVRIACALPETLAAHGDAELLAEALANLVSNALRYSDSPVVCLAAERAGKTVRLIVADEGRGIPVADTARVFERFGRLDPARAAESGGAGLGLAIVRRIARLHGGEAYLEAVVPHGCRFIVEWPA